MIWSLIEAHLFGSMEEDKECDHDHTLIDYSSARSGDKDNCSAGEDNSNMCKDVITKTKSMQSQCEIDSHEDVEWQNELRHAFDVLIDEHENVGMPSQSNVKCIVANVEVGESYFSKVQYLIN